MNLWTEPKITNTARGPIEYAESGQGAAILSLHGAMGAYDQSRILADIIAEPVYRFLAVSRPGYFQTPLSSGEKPHDQADLYASLLDELDIDKAAVMAISGGGPSAIHFALRYPDRCTCLVLASTCGGPIETSIPMSFKITCFLARFPSIVNWMRKSAMKNPEKAASRAITDPVILKQTMDDSESWALYLELMESTFDQMAKRLKGTANDIESTREITFPLEEISVPTLIVHGSKDAIVPYEHHGKVLSERIPGAKHLCVQGGEHTTIFTHRSIVRETVNEFIRKNMVHS